MGVLLMKHFISIVYYDGQEQNYTEEEKWVVTMWCVNVEEPYRSRFGEGKTYEEAMDACLNCSVEKMPEFIPPPPPKPKGYIGDGIGKRHKIQW